MASYKPKERPGMIVYWDTVKIMQKLPADDVKELIIVMADFAQNGTIPEFSKDSPLNFMWDMIQNKLEIDAERYEETREARRQAGLKSAEARKNKAESKNMFNIDII